MDEVSAVKRSVKVFIDSEETIGAQLNAFETVVQYVIQHSMQDLIELLEEFLISEDDRERNRATTLLADIFHHQKLPLGASVIHLYVVFFSHRLSDYPSIIPSLHALISLVQQYKNEFDSKYMDALDMFQCIFRSVPVPSYPQTVRFKVLLLFKELLANQNFTRLLEPHGSEILEGLVNCTEEEKDPRCLQEVFSLMHVAINLFWKSLGVRVALPQPAEQQQKQEDVTDGDMGMPVSKEIDDVYTTMLLSARLFDALACYFPITFTPPPNDPFGITPEGLTGALEDCLCSYLDPTITSLSEEGSDSKDEGDLLSNSVASKRKLHSSQVALATPPLDGNAIVRLSVPFFIDQLSTDMHIAKVHALRALTRIVRTNPLRHRVFGLSAEGSSGSRGAVCSGAGDRGGVSVSAAANKKMSAEDAKLYAMVEDGDADYSDLYVQDTSSAGAAGVIVEELPPQQRLQQTLQQLSMDVFSLCTDQDTMPEHLAELQLHALSFIGELCRAFDAELSTNNRTSWDSFAAPMLDRIVSELIAEVTSAKAKSAIDIAYVMTRMGGDACCGEVLQKLAPFLQRYAVDTHNSVTSAVQRSAQEAQRGVDRVLNLAAANKSTSINSEDGKLAVGLEMLAQLIACMSGAQSANDPGVAGVPKVSHAHDHSHAHGHGHSSHDAHSSGTSCGHSHQQGTANEESSCSTSTSHVHTHSHSHALSTGCCSPDSSGVSHSVALRPYVTELFDALFPYTSPTQVSLSESTSAINPFAAVRSAFAADENPEGVVSKDDLTFQAASAPVVPTLVIPAPAVLAVVGSISAMKELLGRCALDQLPADKLSAYIRNITHLSVHGLPHLFVTDPTVLSVQDDTTGLQQSPAEVLHRSCVSFLVSLCSLQGGDLLLKTHCVSPLLSTLSEECNGSSTVSPGESRPFQVLGAIARECRMPAATDSSYEESLLTVVAPRLLAVIKTSIADCNTGGDRLVISLWTLMDVLEAQPVQPVSSPGFLAATMTLSGCSNQRKAEYLVRPALERDGGGVSIAQQLLLLLHRNIEALVLAPGSTALLALEHTYSLLRRLILALPTALQTTYAASLVHTILAEVSVSTTNGKAFIEGALVSIFVHLDKSSALWGKMNPDLIQKCCEFGRSQLSTTGASASASATSAAAAVFRSPSKADFGASQLIALLINKVQSEDICEHIVHKALAVFSSTVYSDNADFSISAGLLLWTVRSVSMRPNLKVKLTEDWVVSSSESAAAAGGNASALLSSFPRAFSADTSGAATALPTWQEYLVALLLHILTYENAEDNTAGSSTPMCRLQLAVASQMGILTAEHDLILSSTVRASATTAALFWKQKLWSRLFSKLHTGIGSTSTSGSGVNSASAFSTSASPSQSFVSVLRLLSVCTLSTGMPVNIMQDSLVQLVSVVVTAMSYKPASATAGGECAAYIGACAVMVQQSMCTLEVLLKHDAQLFIPYLNIVMPSLVETSQSATSAKLRATALEGLLSITEHVPYARLFPFKALVSKGLARALDDRKKAVRVLAGRVRNKWIVMK